MIMIKIYNKSCSELVKTEDGYELLTTYVKWYMDNAEEIMEEYFGKGYTEDQVMYGVDTLAACMLGEFNDWYKKHNKQYV